MTSTPPDIAAASSAPRIRRRRGRPRHPGRGRQCARSHGGDGGEHRRRLSAHEPRRRRRLLAGARALGPRARHHGAGSGRRERDARALSRRRTTIPARGPLAALTVPGAVGGWRLALEAAKAHGGKIAARYAAPPAIRHARDGYAVTRSQARLTAEKLAELKDVPGFAATFLVDGKPPEAGTTLKQTALAGDARPSRPCRAR